MHTHRIKFSARPLRNCHSVSGHLHFIFLPANERLIDEQFRPKRKLKAASTDLLKFLTVVGDAAATAAR